MHNTKAFLHVISRFLFYLYAWYECEKQVATVIMFTSFETV